MKFGPTLALLAVLVLLSAPGSAGAGCPNLTSTATGVHGGNIYDLHVVGEYAYALGEGFSVIDVSDPQNIHRVGHFAIDGFNMAVDGLTVYIINSEGLSILDISQPEDPRQLSSLPYPDLRSVAVCDRLVVVSEPYVGLHIIDVSDLLAPTVVGHFPEYIDPSDGGFAIYGPYVLFADHSDFSVISLEDPTSPQLVGSYTGYFWWISEIEHSGRFAYLADRSGSSIQGAGGLQVFDLSDPTAPQLVAYYHPHPAGGGMASISVSGRLAILGGTGGGGWIDETHILDITDPTDPVAITILQGTPVGVQLVGTRAYLWSGDSISILGVGDCYHPTIFADGFDSGDVSAWSASEP